MPSGSSCRQSTVSKQLARHRRTAWKKVLRTFSCCFKPRGDSIEVVGDEYMSSTIVSADTTSYILSQYGPHPRVTSRNNNCDNQHRSQEVIRTNIERDSPHSHVTRNTIFAASNNNEPSESLVTSFNIDGENPSLSKATLYKNNRAQPIPSPGDLRIPYASPRVMLLTIPPPVQGHLDLCKSPREIFTPSSLFGELPFPYRSPGEVFTPSTSFGEVLFPYRPPEEVSSLSPPPGELPFPNRPPGEVFIPSTSFGELSSPYRSPGEVLTPSTSFGEVLFPYRPPGEVSSLSPPPGELPFPNRPHGEVFTPSTPFTPSFGMLTFPNRSPREVCAPSPSRGEVLFPFRPPGEVSTSSPKPGEVPFLYRSPGKVFTPSTSPTPLFPCISSAEVFTISPSIRALPFHHRSPREETTISLQPSATVRSSCIPLREGCSPSLSLDGSNSCTLHQFVSTFSVERSVSASDRNQSYNFSGKNEMKVICCSDSVASCCSISRQNHLKISVSFQHGSFCDQPICSRSSSTQRVMVSGGRLSCLSHHTAMTVTYSPSSSAHHRQVFTRSAPVTSMLTVTFEVPPRQCTSLITCGQKIPTFQWMKSRSKLPKEGLSCLVPCKQWQSGFLDQNMKSQSLPIHASEEIGAKFHGFTYSLPVVLRCDGFHQETASCHSECFILSNSTVSPIVSKATFCPSYGQNVSLQAPVTSMLSVTFEVSARQCTSLMTGGEKVPTFQWLHSRSKLPYEGRSCVVPCQQWQSGFVDQPMKCKSLPVYTSGKYGIEIGAMFHCFTYSLPAVLRYDGFHQETASYHSEYFILSNSTVSPMVRKTTLCPSYGQNPSLQALPAASGCSVTGNNWESFAFNIIFSPPIRSSVGQPSSPGRNFESTSPTSAVGDSPLGSTASCYSACFKSSNTSMSTASGTDRQTDRRMKSIRHEGSTNLGTSSNTFSRKHFKSTSLPRRDKEVHATTNHHSVQRKETNNNTTVNRHGLPAAEPVIGLGDAPHLVKNILKRLSVEGNHRSFSYKSLPAACPIIPPLDLTDVVGGPVAHRPMILGEGSFGVVQLMKHLPRMKLCAVKVPKEDLEKDRMYENFFLEVNILTSLRDLDCVPRLYGVSRAGKNLDVPIIVQQFIGDPHTFECTTLQKAIVDKVLSCQKSMSIALQVCKAVAEIHTRRILHCDLKVDNILLLPGFIDDDYPKINIIDFGMAASMDGEPRYERIATKHQDEVSKRCLHLAPELIRGEKPHNVCTEVYSLGLVLKNLSYFPGGLLKDLGQQCMSSEFTRPTIEELIKRLESHLSPHHSYN